MTASTFEKEVRTIRERFNRVFGEQGTVRIQARYAALLAICQMGILEKRVGRMKEAPREDIKEFIRLRDSLTTLLNIVEKQTTERRRYDNREKQTHSRAHG